MSFDIFLALDLVVEVARMADLVVLPAGCPACVVAEARARELPAELAQLGVELVRTGRDLREVIRRSARAGRS